MYNKSITNIHRGNCQQSGEAIMPFMDPPHKSFRTRSVSYQSSYSHTVTMVENEKLPHLHGRRLSGSLLCKSDHVETHAVWYP